MKSVECCEACRKMPYTPSLLPVSQRWAAPSWLVAPLGGSALREARSVGALDLQDARPHALALDAAGIELGAGLFGQLA